MEGSCRSYLVDFDFLFGSANDLDLCSVLGDSGVLRSNPTILVSKWLF